MRRHWTPCRKCGAIHQNPRSSSLCQSCGEAEGRANEAARRAEREDFESSPFGQFMSLPEDERWRAVFDRLSALEENR